MHTNEKLFGFDINKLSIDEIVSLSLDTIHKKEKILFACANAHSLMVSKRDKLFHEALLNTDLLVADGSGVSLAGKLLNTDFGPRITGFDYFINLTARINSLNANHKIKVFFFGSSENTLTLITKRFSEQFPNIEICGTHSPPFREWSDTENDSIISIINSAEPDIIWVGMTAPKQEKWAYLNRSKLNAPVIGSIGAVFDFYAGTTNRAPKWMRQLGLEWLHRFIKEPKRTWRRNLISAPLFVLNVIKTRLARIIAS